MRKYTVPTIEIYRLPQEDVVRTSEHMSGPGGGGGSGGSSGGGSNDANNDNNFSPWV